MIQKHVCVCVCARVITGTITLSFSYARDISICQNESEVPD